MKEITLSCCIIACNEEDNIKQCLDSVIEICDEIIVVDTGSTDQTVNIAKQYGANIYYEKWNNDFSKARNISLDHATSDWILILDCDEYIDKVSCRIIKRLMSDSTAEAYWVKIINILENNLTQTGHNVRLVRNNSCYRFQGKIHEEITESIVTNACIKHSDIIIYHYGYCSEKVDIQDKINRNMKILNMYNEKEKDGFYYYNLGSEYLRQGDKKTALELYKISIKKNLLIQVMDQCL